MPTAGDQLPPDHTALARRIAALERDVRELRAAKRAAATTVTSGQFAVTRPDGAPVLGTGRWPSGLYGTEMRRDSGVPALSVSGQDPAYGDMIRIYSRSGAVIAMDDAYADRYLGRPSIPMPWQPTPTAWNYNSTAMDVAWVSAQRVQCAVLYLATQMFAPAGATAEAELRAFTAGAWTVWDTWTAAGGGAGAWTTRETTRPMDGLGHFQHVSWEVRHRRSAGTGAVYTTVLGGYQRHTFTADEVPAAPAE